VADPVRVYEDFASLDLISRGRAEVIVGRSAFVEPFALFGYDTADYDAVSAEKLGLLLDIRAREKVTWAGRFCPPRRAAAVVPRAVQQPLPVWVAVGGSPDSAERAGAFPEFLRLAMITVSWALPARSGFRFCRYLLLAYTPGPVVGGWMACRACSSAGFDTPVQSWANSP
jgi:alkanesulfonate monooxygenase SsuD/methylene tetrahydromethanopterin reductase-like flavin-dependent oxidoreductase (luciferase family)